jgi:hypothetical protein
MKASGEGHPTQTITIEGDLHVAGDAAALASEGLPINVIITGTLNVFSGTRPERGAFMDGPLIVQGTITAAGQGAIEPAPIGRD